MKRFHAMWAVVFFFAVMLARTDAATQTGFGMIEIIVTDQSGTRLSNVNLCLAMPGQSTGRMTDQNGSYKTTLPVGETTIRLSRSGYANAQDTVTMVNGGNFARTIQLQPGQSTPLPSDCGITATAVPGNACDIITAVQATGGTTTTDRRVQIRVEMKDRPFAYRIAEFPQEERLRDRFDPEDAFRKRNVPWQPVAGPAAGTLTTFFNLTEPHYGNHAIYVQTQRYSSGCVSRPRVVTVVLAPAAYQTLTLKGAALQQFIDEAKTRGYEFRSSFSVRNHSQVSNGICGVPGFLQLRKYNTAKRWGDELTEEVDARFEAFAGSLLLKPFWSLEKSLAYHPSLPPTIGYSQADPNRDTMAVVFESYAQSGCPNGCQQSPKRVFSWKRKTYKTALISGTEEQGGNYYCELKGEQQASLTELALKGPAGLNPIDALEDLRVLRPGQLQLTPPPRIIIPRGVDKEEGGEGNERVEPAAESNEKP